MSSDRQALPIGIFDSGVGGLSVLRAVRQQLPHESIVFFADQAHVPYGPRSLQEVRDFAVGISRFLLSPPEKWPFISPVKLIVVACNAASAAALKHLRAVFPETRFVGMEPAVKPAAEHTHSRMVGVLATPATFQGELYASVVERFAHGVTLLQDVCPGLVAQIEAGQLHTPRTRAILETALLPMLDQGIDTVVLGCTHYPFVIPLIQEIAGPGVRVIDPSPAVARQVTRVLLELDLLNQNEDAAAKGEVKFLTSGDPQQLKLLLPALLGENGRVNQVIWQENQLGI